MTLKSNNSLNALFALAIFLSLYAWNVEATSGISFDQRVALQKSIESVYWENTIWPVENSQPKPSLEFVLSDSAIRLKTEQYVRKSVALDLYWGKPITAKRLQAEMDRMARETWNPFLLKELWTALRNDPYLIAECLARPLVVNRITNQTPEFDKWWHTYGKEMDLRIDEPAVHYRLPKIGIKPNSTKLPHSPDGYWTSVTTVGAPRERDRHTAVWTGTHMIVWGGRFGFGAGAILNSGGIYDPATNSWTSTSLTNAPVGRQLHTAVWTGKVMIVWGGQGNIDGTPTDLDTGGRYDPFTNSWSATSTVGAASARSGHTAVWGEKEMIIWGGGSSLNTGGRYNPIADSWTPTSMVHPPIGRSYHVAVWTGNTMVVWGGDPISTVGKTGGIYDPDSWTSTSTFLAPSARSSATAVWSGSQMIVWGGLNTSSDIYFNTGGRFDPVNNVWLSVPTSGAPTARAGHTAVWAVTFFGASRMLVWGGYNGTDYLNTGGRYDPSQNNWTSITTGSAPSARSSHTAVWTSEGMIIWGGYGPSGFVKTGGIYHF